MLFIFYPFIYLSNWRAYKKRLRKNKDYDFATKKEVYKEIFKLNTSFKILTDHSLMVEFEKIMDVSEVGEKLKSQHEEFGRT